MLSIFPRPFDHFIVAAYSLRYSCMYLLENTSNRRRKSASRLVETQNKSTDFRAARRSSFLQAASLLCSRLDKFRRVMQLIASLILGFPFSQRSGQK